MNEIKILMISPSSPSTNGMPRSGGAKDLSDYMVKMEEYYERFEKARYKAVCMYSEIYKQIELIPNEDERSVLTYRYLHNREWEWIADKLKYSVRQIYRIHGRALSNFNMS